ncbi:MAG: hypothetical protein JXB30_01115 [Anaerolineae bacterium]|nr:hypothetical protein [Anaerolineae bacterium]
MHAGNWKSRPLYVWLFALYPIVFLFSQNVGRVIEEQVVLSIGIALLGTTILFALMFLVSRDRGRAGMTTGIVVLALSTYGHVYNLIDEQSFEPFLTALYIVLSVGGVVLIVWKRPAFPERAAPYLNIVGAVLILMTLSPIVNYYYRSSVQSVRAEETATNKHPQLRNSPERPDIYYIILDGYSGNTDLLRDYGYDNSDFTDALEERGFYVAYDSKTTYGVTLVSLAASLNMRYIDESDRVAAQDSRSVEDYFHQLVTDSLVAKKLQSHGYTYVFVLTGFTSPSMIADVNIDFHPEGPVYFSGEDIASGDFRNHDSSWFYQRPFFPLLLETTALLSFADDAQEVPTAIGEPYKYWAPERALMTWDEAEKIPAVPEATFAFIHIIKPHVPISFDSEGNRRPYLTKDTPIPVREKRFLEELQFVNARTLEMLDAIIANSSPSPIIILQADHGSVMGHPESLDGRRTNFEILNTYRFPGQESCIHDRDIIPINSFRSMFNCYFGGDYPMLEARYYAMPDNYDDLFHHEPVDILEWQAEQDANGRERRP